MELTWGLLCEQNKEGVCVSPRWIARRIYNTHMSKPSIVEDTWTSAPQQSGLRQPRGFEVSLCHTVRLQQKDSKYINRRGKERKKGRGLRQEEGKEEVRKEGRTVSWAYRPVVRFTSKKSGPRVFINTTRKDISSLQKCVLFGVSVVARLWWHHNPAKGNVLEYLWRHSSTG